VVSEFRWDPHTYLEMLHEEIPAYERLQRETAAASGSGARTLLELGTGTGETARAVLERHPDAVLTGIDSSPEMLGHARLHLPAERVRLRLARLEDELPAGEFDVIFSALAVHHLDGPGKANLFARVAARLAGGGRFVLGDLVVPEDPADVVTEIDGLYETPSTLAEQLRWLADCGLHARVAWAQRDLGVIVAFAV
jgi:tRNA (cmo5U34)-methyltransferase